MSHHKLREEKDCLNCGAKVEERFCPNCGQENSINRPSFHYLFTHFAEDFVHYDSGFWKTMKFLLFKPGRIILDYLDGKRKTYMPPVKLYIFVSFVAFFLPHILSFSENKSQAVKEFNGIEVAGHEHIQTIEQLDSLQNILPAGDKLDSLELAILRDLIKDKGKGEENELEKKESQTLSFGDEKEFTFGYQDGEGYTFLNENYKNIKTVVQFDSIHHSLPPNKRMNWFSKLFAKKVVDLHERGVNKDEELGDKYIEMFVNNLPKALFIYLPVFAFFLWLFHSKKKWLYYDHGIFTLYYFSFLLILITLNIFLNWGLGILDNWFSTSNSITNYIGLPIFLISVGYAFFYFFRAHSRVYKERKIISRTKSFVLFWINSLFLLLTLIIYTVITFILI